MRPGGCGVCTRRCGWGLCVMPGAWITGLRGMVLCDMSTLRHSTLTTGFLLQVLSQVPVTVIRPGCSGRRPGS
ncbi:hypothetical protein CXF34_00050 [Corynebacterium bovis]|uniref:Uncharacterized protein n=1 Tax=Corynebacterium bovis TaxID=36808 RepID=A0A426Q4R6_9CORY|nr:hypothetical protein CXF42_05500 [Corynebacterium bovis]RRQ13566.1 hypothetical protein CXF34_00050 [Corynebacterium bovis]